MPRRIRRKTSLLAPAGNLLKKLSNTDQRLRRRVLTCSLWGLGVLFAFSLLFGNYGIPRIIRLHFQKQALVEANRQLTAQLIDSAREREMLRFDPDYIEQIARTRYYMVRPGEIIYRFRVR
jgi:cell division protein FtsB